MKARASGYGWVLPSAAAIGVLAAASWTSWGRQASDRKAGAPPARIERKADPIGSTSLVEAMLKPSDLPFQEPTTLAHAAEHLRRLLGAPVVIDPAALDRKDLTTESTVRLDRLKGVRLKTALRLLLEPVGLVARVFPEDHLLLITDPEGSEDPNDRILAELKAIHRELHQMQTDLDDVYASVVDEDALDRDEARPSKASNVRRKVESIRSRLRAGECGIKKLKAK